MNRSTVLGRHDRAGRETLRANEIAKRILTAHAGPWNVLELAEKLTSEGLDRLAVTSALNSLKAAGVLATGDDFLLYYSEEHSPLR